MVVPIKDGGSDDADGGTNVECLSAVDFLADEVWSQVFASDCATCHLEGGYVDTSFEYVSFILKDPVMPQNGMTVRDVHAANLEVIMDHRFDDSGAALLLEKAQGGLYHGGGLRFTDDSTQYALVERLFAAYEQGESEACTGNDNPDAGFTDSGTDLDAGVSDIGVEDDAELAEDQGAGTDVDMAIDGGGLSDSGVSDYGYVDAEPEAPSCVPPVSKLQFEVWPLVFENRCTNCHYEGGVADNHPSNVDFILADPSNPGRFETAADVHAANLELIVARLYDENGEALLLLAFRWAHAWRGRPILIPTNMRHSRACSSM